jgi:type IV pilus assembly protein PilV
MNQPERNDQGRDQEAGFTLVEVLVAIVVLVFGLIAVTNLLVVGASNNAAANHGTAATALASRRMEMLKADKFSALASGTELVQTPGVGPVTITWTVTRPRNQVALITVVAEGIGPMIAARSRITLTTVRACVAEIAGCPAP